MFIAIRQEIVTSSSVVLILLARASASVSCIIFPGRIIIAITKLYKRSAPHGFTYGVLEYIS